MNNKIGRLINPYNVVEAMLTGLDNWDALCYAVCCAIAETQKKLRRADALRRLNPF